MSNWSVTVLTPNGRRHVQRCGPNTTLLQILEDTCQKHGFTAEEYDLTHHNRVVDSTNILRFSGLPNNAFLEMAPAKRIRVETEVVLVLALENGNQLHGKFKPSTTLLEVLTSLLPSDELKLSSNPVVIYMRRSIQGESELKETTLKNLGLTGGRAMIRLLHRTAEQLNTQANVSAPLPTKIKEEKEEYNFVNSSKSLLGDNKLLNKENVEKENIEVEKAVEVKEEDSLESNQNENSKEDNEKLIDNSKPLKSQDFYQEPIKEEIVDESKYTENVIIVGERNALVFSQEMSNHLPFSDLPDDFYDLSVTELKKLYLQLGKRREELENTPLKTATLRNIEELEKEKAQMRRNQQVILRIIFPDRTVLQGNFTPLDEIKTVKEFVCSYLQDPSIPFDLYITPPKYVLPPKATLLDVKCVPTALIYFGPHDDTLAFTKQYLKDSIVSQLSTPEAALLTASKLRGLKKNVSVLDSNKISTSECGESSKMSETPSQSSTTKDSKTPKWFKANVK